MIVCDPAVRWRREEKTKRSTYTLFDLPPNPRQHSGAVAHAHLAANAVGYALSVTPLYTLLNERHWVDCWRSQFMVPPPPNRVVRAHSTAITHLVRESGSALAVKVYEQEHHERGVDP